MLLQVEWAARSMGQLLFEEPWWSIGHLLSDIVVADQGVAALLWTSLSTILSFIYTSSPINSASSLSSSSVRPSAPLD